MSNCKNNSAPEEQDAFPSEVKGAYMALYPQGISYVVLCGLCSPWTVAWHLCAKHQKHLSQIMTTKKVTSHC